MKWKPFIGSGNCNGQATIEFLLTLVIALVLITVVVFPNYYRASEQATDAANLAKLRSSAEKLVNSVQYVSVAGVGTKQTIGIVVPAQGAIRCAKDSGACQQGGAVDCNVLRMDYNSVSIKPLQACGIDDDSAAGTCAKALPTYARFSCTKNALPETLLGAGGYYVTVSKSLGGVQVDATSR